MTDRRRLKDAIANESAPKPPKGFRAMTAEEYAVFKEQGSSMALLNAEFEKWQAKRDLAVIKMADTQRAIGQLQPQLVAFNEKLGIRSDKDIQIVGENVFIRTAKVKDGNGKHGG